MLLTDIAVEHTLASKTGRPRETFFLHLFTNTQRDSLGKFEIVLSVRPPGVKEVKCSTFVSFQHLAELHAEGGIALGQKTGNGAEEQRHRECRLVLHRHTAMFVLSAMKMRRL